MNKQGLISIFLCLSFLSACSGSSGQVHTFDVYDGLLKKHVSYRDVKGDKYAVVDYNTWGKDGKSIEALQLLLTSHPESLSGIEKMVFWINAYNLLTIDLIVKNNETKSINNLKKWGRSPWKSHSWKIGGKSYTLDEVEHKILRQMGDPRIHFAIVCASMSCPDLRAEAYSVVKLESQLDDQTRTFLNNKSKGFLKTAKGLKVSEIFNWFGGDFGGKEGVVKFVEKYQGSLNGNKITYFEYDWGLNGV